MRKILYTDVVICDKERLCMTDRLNDELRDETFDEQTDAEFFVLSSPMPEKKQPKKKEKKPFKFPKPTKAFWAIVTAAVVLIGLFVGGGIYFEHRYQQELLEEYNKSAKEGLTYFLAEATEPEKSEKEVTALITEAYYTNDGSLAVFLCFANGMDSDQNVQSVDVTIRNDEEEVIASGYSDTFDLVVPKDGTANLTLYMAPQHVKISNDSLNTIAYDISTEYIAVE